MSSLPPQTVIAGAVGILSSAWASGGQAMLSLLAIPGLLTPTAPPPAPQMLAQQWAGIYSRGKSLGPQTAILAVLGYGYLAYDQGSGGRWGRFAGAAALTLAIVPFTLMFMAPTNQKLFDVAAGTAGVVKEGSVEELLVRWKGLNLVRSLWPLAGAVVGLWGLVGH
ncbi:unnamed protein product [Discula destructiva]